jgi:hypothetical protein
MKKLLVVVGCLLTVVVTPAFAQAVISKGERPFGNLQQVSDNGHSAFAQGLSRARHPVHVKHKVQDDSGIFENLPVGVTDPYAYHNQLMEED